MNYTNYIINGKIIDINSVISKKKYLKQITIIAAIPVAFFGFFALLGFLPFAFMADRVKDGEMMYLKAKRKYKRDREFNQFLEGISDNKEERSRIKKMYE